MFKHYHMSRNQVNSGEEDGESDTPTFEGQMIFKGDYDAEDGDGDE